MNEATTARMTYLDALGLAQREEMARDDTVIIIGEDISLYAAGGAYGDIDAKRIRSAPISENGGGRRSLVKEDSGFSCALRIKIKNPPSPIPQSLQACVWRA